MAHTYETQGFHTVQLTVEYEDGTTSTNTRHITLAIPRPIAFVSNIIMDDQSEAGVVTAKITVVDAAIELVEGAKVEARWTVNGVEGTKTLTAETNAAGKAFYSINKRRLRRNLRDLLDRPGRSRSHLRRGAEHHRVWGGEDSVTGL